MSIKEEIDYECGCGGTYIYQKDKFDDYFQCIVEIYKCDNCNYIWGRIKPKNNF